MSGEDHAAGMSTRRNADGTFRQVCDWLVWHHRTKEVNAALEAQLRRLDSGRWHFERDVSIASASIPFLLLGETGVFLLQASRGYWTNHDITEMCCAASTLRRALPGYPDPVNCGIVMLEELIDHRQHFACSGEGPCWIVAGELLVEWLYGFDHRGLSRADIEYFREWASSSRLAEPRRLFIPAAGESSPETA